MTVPSDVPESHVEGGASDTHASRSRSQPAAGPSLAAPAPSAPPGRSSVSPGAGRSSVPSAPLSVDALRTRLAEQKSRNRLHEYVKTLMALGDALTEPSERVPLYLEAAELYSTKFMNQAEAVRAHERIVALQPDNAASRDYLLQMYERRRDWEKLIELRTAGAEQLDPAERRALYKELALLADERIKKPVLSIEMWRKVSEGDPDDADALDALCKLYERNREYEQLADALQRLSRQKPTAERIVLLNKLGQIVGDRLKDEARAIEVYRELLTLTPDDRRAQEQLKKRYIALGQWDELEAFYAGSERWEEFIRVLESSESRCEDPGKRVALLRKIAELWERKRERPERAARAYEKILELEPTHQDAAARLVPIYERANNAAGLASVLEVKLTALEPGAEAVQLHRRLAELYETKLSSGEKAFAHYQAVFRVDPMDGRAQDDLERVAAKVGSWPAVVEGYCSARDSAHAGGAAEFANALRLRLGRIYVDELGSVSQAIEQYAAALEQEPTSTEALDVLERLYQQTEQYDELLKIYERRQDLAPSTAEKVKFMHHAARVLRVHGRDPERAIATYEGIVEVAGADGDALRALTELFAETAQWPRYVETLQRRLEVEDDAGATPDLHFRLAEAQSKHLGQWETALDHYSEVLTAEPRHSGARVALEAMLQDPKRAVPAARMLATIYEQIGEHQRLISVSELLARSAASPDEQVRLWTRVSEIAEQQLGELGKAFDARAKALRIAPEHEASRDALERLAPVADRQQDLGRLYHDLADELHDPMIGRQYRLLAAGSDQALGDIQGAAATLEALLEREPADSEVLDALEGLYRHADRPRDVVATIGRRLGLVLDDQDKIGLYERMAVVYERDLRQPQEAARAHQAILALDSAQDKSLVALERIWESEQQWSELLATLEARLVLAEERDLQRNLRMRMADVLRNRLASPARAVEIYREVLERDPYDDEALVALEKLGTGDLELTVAELLEPLYQQRGDYERLVRSYEVQARRASDGSRRIDLLHRVGHLHEEVGTNLDLAFDAYARALALDPMSELSASHVERISKVSGRHDRLAQSYEALAEQQSSSEVGAHLFAAAAQVLELQVQDVARAKALYRRVLELEPGRLAAIEALERLLKQNDDYEELSQLLQSKSRVLGDDADRKVPLFEAGLIEKDVLGRPEHAVKVYESVLKIDQDDMAALDALADLYLGLSRWKPLLAVQQRKAELLDGVEDKKAVYYQMGAVYERELEDLPRAIDTYQRVLELDPDDIAALGRLDVLYQAEANWHELLTILVHEAELAGDPNESTSYRYRIAELYEQRLGDTPRAIELYRELLVSQPEHEPTLAALERLKGGGGPHAAVAARALEPVYEALGAWKKLISTLEVQAEAAQESFEKVDRYQRIATIHEQQLHDLDSAFHWYGLAVAQDPRNEVVLLEIERLAGITDRWADVARLYDSLLPKLEDQELRVELGLRVAQVYEVQIGDIDAAVNRHRSVLEWDAENHSAIRSLGRLFTRAQRWAELAETLKREAAGAHSPDEILDCKFRLGQVQRQHLQNPEAAVTAFEEVLGSAPEHEAARVALEELFDEGVLKSRIGDILEPLYEAEGQWERLVQVHEAQLAAQSAPERRSELYHRLAEDYEVRLLDSERAFGVMTRALAEEPLDQRVREALERLADSFEGGWEELANSYADVMSVEGVSRQVQVEIGSELARVFEDRLQDVVKAEEAYRYVLTVVPGEAAALENLDRIYLGREQWAELAGVLEQRAVGVSDDAQRVELYIRLGRVYEEKLAQPDAALRAYRLIFDQLEPTNAEVAAALVPLYETQEQWTELEVVYKRQLDIALGDAEQSEIRAKLARLYGERLNRDADAIDGWKRVLDLRGEDAEALEALAKLYERGKQWAELSTVLERLYDVALEDEARVDALTRRARLFAEALGRKGEALDAWQRVLDIDFANVTALRAIADLRRSSGEHRELVDALHQLADRGDEQLAAEELRETYRELARLYQGQLGESGEAAECWKKLLGVDAKDLEALDQLERIYRGEGRWPEVVDVKVQRASALEEPEAKVAQLLEAATIWKEQVKEYDQAVDVLQKVLQVDPTHEFAFQELEKLHTLAERWEPLIELYLARLEATEDSTVRAELLRRIARVFERNLGDENQAFDALVSAFAEDFASEETAGYLERMAQATQRWGELIGTTNEWLKEQTDDRKRIQLCLRLGKWYGENLGRPEYAQPYYAQIHKLDPHNAQVLRQMAHIYRQGAQWGKMGDSLRQALNVAVSNDDRKAILVDLGQFLVKHQHDRDQGVAHYNQALELDPHYLPALEALEGIYTDEEQYDELAGVLARKAEAVREPGLTAAVQLRLGEIHERRLEAWDRASAAYRAVVEYDDSNLSALRGLQRVYEKLQQWPELVQVLERQLEFVETGRERLDALLKLAEVQEVQFLKADAAAENLERVLEFDPTEIRAYESLERCYRRQRQWERYVSTCERHIFEVTDVATKADLYEKIARVYADEVHDIGRAIEAYQNIVDLLPERLGALESLSRLYEAQGDHHQSIEYLVRVAEQTQDVSRRVDMFYRIGKAFDQKLGDRGRAKERFELALDLQPNHVPTLTALRDIAREEGEWDAVAGYLEREQENTPSARARAKLLVELGRVREELGEQSDAIAAYERAIALDDECEEAAEPLLKEYVARERWQAAVPLAEMLLKRGRARSPAEQHALALTLAQVQQALGNYKEALKAYQTAHQLDVSSLETVRGLAQVAYELRDWAAALVNYQKVLSALDEDDIEQRTDVYFRIGKIKQNQDQEKQAVGNFEKALSLDPHHRPSLEAMVEYYQAQGQWPAVAGYLRRILDDVLDQDERWTLLGQIAQVWGEKAKEPKQAIEALEEARDLRPRDHVVLHQLLNLYGQSGQWQAMVETLAAIAELEAQPERKARYLYTMAQLYRDKLDDRDRAVELFNDALDASPDLLEAFERINKILTQSRDWKQLERQYRKMLHRISGKGRAQLEFNLWHQLGLVYRDRLSQVKPALEAFKMASNLQPDNAQERVILSELHEMAEQFDEAVAQQRILLGGAQVSASPYRALFRLFRSKQSWDQAWCAASVLVFMKQASSEETAAFERGKPSGMPQVKGRLSAEHWARLLTHSDESVYISKIFEMIAPAALQAKVAMLRGQGQLPELDKRLKQDPKSSTVTFAKTFFWAANVLGVHPPDLYVRSDVPGSVVAVPTLPPASLAGQTVLTGFTPQELMFICGKHIAAYRPEHYIRTLFPTQAELTIMLFAGVGLAAPATPMPADMVTQIRLTAQELARYMQPVQIEGLRAVVKRFIDDGAKAHMKYWNRAVEFTACRAGLALCGDLEICKKVLSAEPQRPGEPTATDKMKDLLTYVVSEEYAQVRAALGVSVKSE